MTEHFKTQPHQGTAEPIAIIGIGCRFAGGVEDPDSYWQMLSEGRDGLVDVPADRWAIDDWYDPDRDAPGKMNFRRAGFLRDGIDRFDAGFFGIAPREAALMDPLQRLFLELAHEALEDAGVPPDSLNGASAGIFAGAYFGNYALTARGAPDPDLINGWSATGGHSSVIAGRLAYTLGTAGPALIVDTACSSSLVAVHLAVQSLRQGECDMALTGGVHLLSAPEPLVASTKLGATAPDGQCKAFDAAADGFGHGEGGGIIVLKRLSDAVAAGDRIAAVIRGTAVNQDGRSNSLTAPNGPAQERVIGAALANGGVAPAAVRYVETHGTGTALGDPIEVEALGRVLGRERDAPLLVGSVKANIGHTEAAAGIAGLIKAVLVAENGRVPPQPAFHRLNDEIAALGMPVDVATDLTELTPTDEALVVGVSAFGFGGTNAHAVLEAAPRSGATAPSADPEIVVVSARSEDALTKAVDAWADRLCAEPDAFAAIARTSTAGRRHWPHRVAVVADDAGAAAAALRSAPRAGRATVPRIGFLFTGQGSQYAGMASALYRAEPVFQAALDRHFATLDAVCDWDSRAVLFGDGPIDDTAIAQPLLVAVELALAAYWTDLGIRPAAVMGHSVGEIAAAAVSGAIGEEDALRFAVARGRAMQALPAGGGMLSIFAPQADVTPLFGRLSGPVSIAALNGPLNTVVAGALPELSALETICAAEGLDARALSVSHAFHSPLIEPALPNLRESAGGMVFRTPSIPLISNVSAAPLKTLDADYWCDHALHPVRFADSLTAMQDLGVDLCLEIGPDAILSGLARMAAPDLPTIASLRRSIPDTQSMPQAMAALYRAGAAMDLRSVRRGLPPVRAPLTRFQRTRHWLDMPAHPKRKPQSAPPSATDAEQGSALIYDFYDELTVISANYEDATDGAIHEEGHLTFGLLPAKVPDFSWVRALFEKNLDPTGHALLRQTQGALKEAIFADIDFDGLTTIFDYGCGHAADLASLVLAHPHLRGRGYTISAGQVEVGRRRLAALGLDDRIRVDRADSARTPFPTGTDLIFGVEVTGLIGDKDGLFANIANGLSDGGLLVIADFIATHETIANPDTHSYTPVAQEWADLLGRHKLRLVRALDASAPVARWLDAPDFAGDVDSVVARYRLSDLTRRHLLSNGNIGNALRADLMRYVLMRAVSSPHETVESVTAANLSLLQDCPHWKDKRGIGAAWTYRLENIPAPMRPDLDPAAMVASVEPALRAETTALAGHVGAGAAIDDLARGYLQAALRRLGAKRVGDMVTLPIAERHRRLAVHLAGQLGDPSAPIPDPGDLVAQHLKVSAEFPAAAAELRLLERCGRSLADVLTGDADPLDLLFPGGDAGDAEALYERSPFSAALQRLAAELCGALPRDVPLNVIEVGGGTGATTAHIRDRLPDDSRYLFTDLGPALAARATARFADAAFTAMPYDIETPPAAAGLATGAFDLAVAANMLHATRDLSKALDHLHEMLAPGGMVLLVENTGPFLWGDLTFGLTPGMWAFAEDGQRHHALIPPEDWRMALTRAGFRQIEILDPGNDEIGAISRQCVIVAQKPALRRFGLFGASDAIARVAPRLAEMGHDAVRVAEPAALPGDLTDLVYFGTDGSAASRDHLRAVHRMLPMAALPQVSLVSDGTPSAAVLEGLARGIAAEYPESRARVLSAEDGKPLSEQVDTLIRALIRAKSDTWLTGDTLSSRVLLPCPASGTDQLRLSDQGCYLVTGAYGGLGPHLVRWLHDKGARRFVLAGRHAASQAVRDMLHEVDAVFEVADISDADAVARLVSTARDQGGLRGVFHAAGALSDAALNQQTAETLTVPLASKCDAVALLDQATDEIDLDHFVIFSSIAGLLAPFGQANHAAAATGVAAQARAMAARGRRVLCVDWGAFAQAGAAMRAGVEEKVAKSGLAFMAPDQAFEVLGRAMVSGETELAIVDADWSAYVARYPKGGVPHLLQALGTEPGDTPAPAPAPAADDGADGIGWLARLRSAPQGHRRDLLHDLIRAEAARILQLPETDLRDDAPLREAGLDSLMSIEFRNALSRATNTRLGATLVFDYPSVRDLAAHLSGAVFAHLFPASPPPGDDDLEGSDAETLSRLLAAELNDAMGAD